MLNEGGFNIVHEKDSFARGQMVAKKPMLRRRLPWHKKLLFCAITWASLVLGAEFVAKLCHDCIVGGRMFEADGELGYVLRPSLDMRRQIVGNQYYHFRTDEHGRRVIPATVHAKEGSSVVILGDSIAFGQGVNDDQTVGACLAEHG